VSPITLTVNWHTETFPASSVALEVTSVFPIGNTLPEAGEETITGSRS
jgi:hypothetical protein